MQVDPTKPTLKAPGSKRLKLKHDGPLSNFAFKFNLRRYIESFTCKLFQTYKCAHNSFTPDVQMSFAGRD